MHISQSDLVRARRRLWRVADLRRYEVCDAVTLVGLNGPTARRTLLLPFDTVERIERRVLPKRVSPRAWRRVCRAALTEATAPDQLRSAVSAAIDLLPYQLTPALAIVSGAATRLLLADDVGMGKTVQAGLIAAELMVRATAERVLVVVPAGLRDQWASELRERFALDTTVVDAAYLRRAGQTLPVGVNPWTAARVAVTSVDYIKRVDVLVDAAARRWDLVVVDEAHNAVGRSDRHAAVTALAGTATYVVLMTATPHNGDEAAFASLCALGEAADAPLVVFRRRRADVGLAGCRKIHRLLVTPSAAERRMHALLIKFSRIVAGEHGDRASLGLSVLMKRALSSARALELSILRRLAALGGVDVAEREQLLLPFGETDIEGEGAEEDRAPDWPDGLELENADRERRLLTVLAKSAAAAAVRESKVDALERLLRRVDEPVLVFTEYRDTLVHLAEALPFPALLLHGGVSRADRSAAVARFGAARGARLLLATDAAAEGLNLHERCRLVVNLELPCNPIRLEQRIGRVDRIGQQRTVHAFHLIARGLEESRMLGRLRRKVAVAQRSIAAADPLGDRPFAASPMLATEPPIALVTQGALEAARACAWRAIGRAPGRPSDLGRGPLISRCTKWETRARVAGRWLTIWRIAAEDANGRTIASTLVGVSAAAPVVADAMEAIADRARSFGDRWLARVATAHRSFVFAARLRTLAVEEQRRRRQQAIQPGLFDHRVERAARAVDAAERAAADALSSRVAALDRALIVSPVPPELLLILEG